MTVHIIDSYLKQVNERLTGDPVVDNEIMVQAYKLLSLILGVKGNYQ